MSKKIKSHAYCTIIFLWQLLHFVLSSNDKEKSYSTSINGMVDLLEIEMKLIDSVAGYATELQMKVDALNNLVNELKDENHKSLNKREEYLFNPLNGFSLIRRLYNDWAKIELFMAKPVSQQYFSILQKYRTEMPTGTDIMEASSAIYRLQTVYDLQVNDLVHGMINGKQYDSKLKSIDSYFMGYYLFTKQLYYPAGVWLNYCINNFEKYNDHHHIMGFGKEQPLKLYAESLVLQNRPTEALRFITQSLDLQPLDPHLLKRKSEIQILANTRNDAPLQFPPSMISNYELGCRGHFVNQTSKMFCLYNTTTTPFLRLAPIKMEILNFEPYIVVFHDVISDQEIEHIINLASPNLTRARVFDDKVWNGKIIEDRTSQYSSFKDDVDEIIERINKRIADMTGFDVADMEVFQVGNYIMGGHYDIHYDFFNVSDLSDVEQGGATVFPEIKVAMFPRKGSALMWYNLNNRVEADDQTLHAACPVIVGSKWVCTKWIRAKAQIFKKPCYK